MKIKNYIDSDDNAQVDLTPLIDVVFILLIFFVLSASFNQEKIIPVERPSARSSQEQAVQSLQVNVDQKGVIWLDKEQLSKSQLRQAVHMRLSSLSSLNAVLNADKAVTTGRLIEIIDTLRIAGINDVAVATKPQ